MYKVVSVVIYTAVWTVKERVAGAVKRFIKLPEATAGVVSTVTMVFCFLMAGVALHGELIYTWQKVEGRGAPEAEATDRVIRR